MSSSLSWSPDIHLNWHNEQQELFLQMTPFLERAAALVGTGESADAELAEWLTQHPVEAAYFDFDLSRPSETFRLKEEHLFPQFNPITRISFCAQKERALHIDIEDQSDLRDIADLIRACSGNPSWFERREGNEIEVNPSNLEALQEEGFIYERGAEDGSPIPADFEGIVRLQHACLLFRSGGKGLIIDPHLHSINGAPFQGSNTSCQDVAGRVDAVAISHLHDDHYNLPTLMMFPLDTPILVPKIPRRNLIADDIKSRLESIGFTRVIEMAWDSEPFVLGDMKIHALPFYGEQPLLHGHPAHQELRNWGNTYVVRTPQLTSWVLIDSGNEENGKMVDVARRVKTQFGHVDVLASTLGEFTMSSPRYITGAYEYWLCLTPSQRREFASYAEGVLTLGPAGVAGVCEALRPTFFLPYAHWWGVYGQQLAHEQVSTAELEAELIKGGVPTKIVPWLLGDTFRLSQEGTPQVSPCLRDRSQVS